LFTHSYQARTASLANCVLFAPDTKKPGCPGSLVSMLHYHIGLNVRFSPMQSRRGHDLVIYSKFISMAYATCWESQHFSTALGRKAMACATCWISHFYRTLPFYFIPVPAALFVLVTSWSYYFIVSIRVIHLVKV